MITQEAILHSGERTQGNS